jgi:N-acetylmuramoyl-L-alanine amidase
MACCVLSAAAFPAGIKHVTAIRFWPLSDATRVAIEVSGDFEYYAERLTNPDRIFFDIDARPYVNRQRFTTVEVGGRLIQRIRVAETQPGKTRVVFDLVVPADYTTTQLVNPDRLVIEFRASQSPPQPATEPPPVPPAAGMVASAPAEVRATEPPPSRPAPPPPKAATRQNDGGSSLTRALGLKINRVALDPGHGGHDLGTIGPKGLTEKDLVLDVALRLGKLIEERLGAEVVYTRTEDVFIPLEARTALANEKQADLFLSLHANSSRHSRIAGAETYFLNVTTSPHELEVAARENAASQKSIHELRDLVSRITRYEKAEESKDFAEKVQSALHTFSARNHPGLRNRGVKQAPFMVLIGAQMPSVLAEVGFLSNGREETLLKRPDHRQKLAEALYQGVQRYAGSLSRFQVARAAE